jgi:hypothetical protein
MLMPRWKQGCQKTGCVFGNNQKLALQFQNPEFVIVAVGDGTKGGVITANHVRGFQFDNEMPVLQEAGTKAIYFHSRLHANGPLEAW